MDGKLVAWGRAVKSRRGLRGRGGAGKMPGLWLFTDAVRLADVQAALAVLPPMLAGVVLRHVPAGGVLAVSRACRARGLLLSLSVPGGVGCDGLHLRGTRRPGRIGPAAAFLTAPAHNAREVAQARRAGASLIFISPVWPTQSHPQAQGLGVLRFAALARLAGGRAAALGGVDGARVGHLPRPCSAIGGIGAFATGRTRKSGRPRKSPEDG